jgi:branched-chain amino acid transport system substrate-binding protein
MQRCLSIALLAAALASAAPAQADISGRVVKIGILNDQSGTFSDSTGLGSVEAARMAVEDFGGKVAGVPIEIVFADHQNKADVGASIARRWIDEDGVDAIVDLGNSAVALAVIELAKQKNKAALVSGGATTDITGKACAPTTIHWTFDSYSLANALASHLVEKGGQTWYFVTADYNYGKNLEETTAAFVKARGGSVLGAVRHPLGTHDFSSFLLQAQASRAKVVALANGGDDAANALKQAEEFGLSRQGQLVVALNGLLADLRGIGLAKAQGTIVTEPYYWDMSDGTREWQSRFGKRTSGKYASMIQAGVYGVVLHYLKAIDTIKDDGGREAVEAMKAMPTDDPLFGKGTIRVDGRKLHPFYVFQVKSPAESANSWDVYKIIGKVEADQAFRPLSEGGCPLVR